jgi:hypothetical protein
MARETKRAAMIDTKTPPFPAADFTRCTVSCAWVANAGVLHSRWHSRLHSIARDASHPGAYLTMFAELAAAVALIAAFRSQIPAGSPGLFCSGQPSHKIFQPPTFQDYCYMA